MNGLQANAFTNHAEITLDMEPLWPGVLAWTVVLAIVAGLSAVFG